MLNVIMLSVVILNVVAPCWHQEKRSSLLRQKGFMTFGNKEKKITSLFISVEELFIKTGIALFTFLLWKITRASGN